MSGDMASDRRKLNDWEELLRQEVGEGDLLLGELGYSLKDLEDIGGLLYRTIFYRVQKKATIDFKLGQVSAFWPLTFALYLVLEGIHHYGDEGLFWHGPKRRLKIKDNHTAKCGQYFLQILARHNLPTFQQSRGLRYVTPILLHGGIPNHLLDEFLDFLYEHEIQPHRIALDAQALLARWRQKEDDLTALSKPVSRFLRYGGIVAVDFVGRCLDLFRVETESDTKALGLPERVLRAYRAWKMRQSGDVRPKPLRAQIRLQRPILMVAPYTTGIRLEIPPQQFPSRDAPREMAWRITVGNHTQLVETTRQRIENGYRYDASTDLLPVPPSEDYKVELLADEQFLREWILSGFGATPLLLFEPLDDYEADSLGEQEWHKQGERWLLYPINFSLQASGASRLIRELPQMTENWQGYRLEVWKLAPGELTILDESGKQLYRIPVAQEKVRRRPYLANGEQPLSGLSHSDYPLFCGRPPTLVIHTTQAHRWQVSLRGEGKPRTHSYRSYSLSDLSIQRQGENDSIHLDLSADELLGRDPVGRFEITVRGPLGHSHTLGLRMIPPISIEGHDKVYLSQPDEPASLRIISNAATSIRPSPPRPGIAPRRHSLSESQRLYSFTIEAHVQQVSLQLSHETGVNVPFSIPIQRLCWSLHTGLPAGREPQWQTQASAIFPDGLAANAELRVILPLSAKGPKVHAGWRLLDVDGQIVRAVPPDRETMQRLVTIPLTEVLGLWREKQDTLRWQLEMLVEGQVESIIVDLLYLLPDLGIVQYEWKEDADQIHLTVHWEHPHPGQKQLHLWPQDRPWVEVPITLPVPDKENLTLLEWRLPKKNFSSESYLGEIVTYNPWASQQPQRPIPEQSNTFLIKPPGLSTHYAEIIQLRDHGNADAEQLMALFSYQRYNDQMQELYNTNQALTNMRDNLTLIRLIHWAETTHLLDTTAYRSTQLWMFSPSVIDRLVQDEHSDYELERYFRHLRVDKPLEKLHLWVLRSRLRAVPRRQCLKLLCSLTLVGTTLSEVMAALLEDVGDASLLFGEAVTMLKGNSQAAADWLAIQGTQDAAELLRELTLLNDLEVSWIWPKMTVDTSVGPVIIHKLRDRDTGRGRHCAPLSGSCYVDGTLQLSPSVVSVRLDLSNRLLHFSNHSPYQCQHCHRLFSDLSGFARHHQSMHIGQSQARRRLKQDQELAWIRPQIDDEREEKRS